MTKISSVDMLEQVYDGPVSARSRWKQIDHVDELYRKFIEASPFLILASHGENGIDCSPRGDAPGFVRVVSPHCIQLPDRRGSNRLDSMRNILANAEVGLIFLIPNVGETLRVSGKAELLTDAALCESFAVDGKPASSVLSISVERVYCQFQRALVRSGLWSQAGAGRPAGLPTAGQLLQHFGARHGVDVDGERYDAEYAEPLNNKQ
jgi:PPOX class probable FMN-dependent enzyme